MADDFVTRVRPWIPRLVKILKLVREYAPEFQDKLPAGKRRPRSQPRRGGRGKPRFFLFGLVSTLLAALAGNWLGDWWRARSLGQPGHQFKVSFGSSQGDTMIAINPVLTNVLPATLLGLILRPGWFWAFVSGALISALVGNRYEEYYASLAAGLGSRPAHIDHPQA